jgi:hypothetical protein
MAFDFNSVNDNKNKHITRAVHEALFTLSYKTFLDEIKQYNIFQNYTAYSYEIDETKHTISVTLASDVSPFIEPRYIFKFIEIDNNIKINIFIRSDKTERTAYLPAAITRLIKHSSFEYHDLYIIDKNNKVISHDCTLHILNMYTTDLSNDYETYFYKVHTKKLPEMDEDSVLTVQVAKKLPVIKNATILQCGRNAIFDSMKAFNLLVKKMYILTNILGYNADSIYKQGYKRDVTNKFITIYDFQKQRSYSKAFDY